MSAAIKKQDEEIFVQQLSELLLGTAFNTDTDHVTPLVKAMFDACHHAQERSSRAVVLVATAVFLSSVVRIGLEDFIKSVPNAPDAPEFLILRALTNIAKDALEAQLSDG